MLSRVTDLAVEVRESFPDDNVEISGVQIEKTDTGILGITMTVVDIKDEHGAEAMGKPVGEYITLEFSDSGWRKSDEEGFEKVTASCPVPIVIAGGKKLPEHEALEMCWRAIDQGASGVDMGRNIFQSSAPRAMLKAVKKVVHENLNAREAYQFWQEEKQGELK